MRLFLASSELGNYADRLRKLAGRNRRVLIIRNARDYRPEEYVAKILADKTSLFFEYGFDPQVVDLRQFFGKPDALMDYLGQYDPGVIFCLGGNPFILNAALRLSGMDTVIRQALAADAIVYAGESAGTMVAAKNLDVYQCADEFNINAPGPIYGYSAPLEGMGLIDFYPIPHTDRQEFAEKTEYYIRRIKEAGRKPLVMTDSDVYIVNGRKAEFLQAQKTPQLN